MTSELIRGTESIILTLVILFLMNVSTYSQMHDTATYGVDSVSKHFINDSAFTDDEKLDLLNKLSSTFKKSNPLKSDQYLEEAIIIAKRNPDTSRLKELYLEIALSKNRQCDYESAEQYLNLIIDQAEVSNEMVSLPNILYLKAKNYYDWSKYYLARENYERAIVLFKELNDNHKIAQTLTGLSAIASTFGEYQKAMKLMEDARKIYTEMNDQTNLSGTLLGLGVIFEEWGKTKTALTYYNTALESFRKSNDLFQEINLLLHIGDIYLADKNYDSCLFFYNQALQLEPNVNNLKLKSICYSNIGEAYYELKDYQSAIHYQNMALEIKYLVGDKKRIAISLLSLGKIFLATGELKKSEKYLNDCLNISKELNYKETLLESLYFLSKVYEKTGNPAIALKHLHEHIELKERVFNDKSQKELNNLQVKYNAEKIEKENEILRQKDSINILNLEKQKDSFFIAMLVILFIIVIFTILIIFTNIKNRQNKKSYSMLAKKNKEITSQKEKLTQLNKELTYSREQYRSIVENATIGMYQTTREGTIKYANGGLIKMLGYESLEELLLINLNNEQINRQAFIEIIEELHIISGREDIWKRKDGSDMYVFESAWVVKDKDGKIIHYEGIVEDITPRKQAENALRESQDKLEEINEELTIKNQELETLKNEAIAANEVKSQFIANVSHEIRTPLNSITGFSELLSSSIKNNKQLNYINSIKSSSKNLLNLINNILDLSKAQSKEIELIYRPVGLYSLMQDIEQVFKLRLIEKELAFSIFIEKSVPETIYMDEVRFRQIMFNLISNSIKYTDDGSISVSISGYTKNNKTDLIITVVDTGIGINKADYNRIFDAFTQGDDASDNREKGTGLGLSITKQLVEKMGGNIEVESKNNRGSKFTVFLPDVEIAAGSYQATSINRPFRSEEADDTDNIENMVEPNHIFLIDNTILEEFTSKFYSNWAKVTGSGIINDLTVFCNDAISFARNNQYTTLADYFNTLLFYSKQFEVEKIEEFTIALDEVFTKKPKN